ncbi:hypothetical protein BVX94_01045 [bacterium B17]|nr:hypothetical protein BVX94_01045 [bacterium B17]
MNISKFISVGENIHCTRSYKVGGSFVKEADGKNVVVYKKDGEEKHLPIPDSYVESQDWESGKVRHCAVACDHALNGSEEDKAIAVDYIQNMAVIQEKCGATYLDLNVDEFSTDDDERIAMIKWFVATAQPVVSIPMSIDSSNQAILRAGLEACDASRGKPMLNSVSLEREDAISLAEEFKAVVVASAAGRADLPADVAGRLANLDELVPMLKSAGLDIPDMHFDPLVMPISTDGNNGNVFNESVSAIREKYGPDCHFAPGLSNISFGMPNRKLLGQVFAYLFVEAGGDGGIVDPRHIGVDILNNMDTESEGFKLAKDVLTGADDFGMNYITATREGTI